MNGRQLKLGAVTMGAGGPGHHYLWLDPEIPGDASVNINWYIEQARLAEAAKFDLIFIVDSQFITADSPPHYLNRLEPMTLLSALAVSTRHLGLVATMTTSYNDPFNVARRLASLELISGGRAGWNVVTSGDASARAAAGRPGRDHDFTLRQTVQYLSAPRPTPFVGSPQTVADILQRWFSERALDGVNIHIGHPARFRLFSTRWCPSCASAAWSAPSTRPGRCAGTWASRCRRTGTPGPAGPPTRNWRRGTDRGPPPGIAVRARSPPD